MFALGAILCEILTGQPPYTGGDIRDVLHRAGRGDVAEALGRTREALARAEAETERTREAQARARAEQRAKRGMRTLVAALVVGTVISACFAFVAVSANGKLEIANRDLQQSNSDLDETNKTLQRSRDELEATLARSLLKPLALQGLDKPVSDPEWDSLWVLASKRGGRLSYRFVEEASREPVTSRQLRDRAALALHAAVGLDAPRRDEVEKLLLARLDDPALGDEQKTDLALAASAWGALSATASRRMARRLTQALKGTASHATKSPCGGWRRACRQWLPEWSPRRRPLF